MSLSLAQSFAPVYAALPPYLLQDAVAISPRFPRDGTAFGKGGQSIGTSGADTYTPERSVVEAQAWGATVALWSYTNRASSLGYASEAAFIAEFAAAGIPIQGTANTSAVNDVTGPFARDLGGSDWSPGSAGARPALVSGQQNPLNSRINISVSLMPASDSGTRTAKAAGAAAAVAAGCFAVHMDDPRAQAGYSGWRGITQSYDLTSQGADFSPSARAGFTAWLAANTTSSERTAIGLPSSTAGFDIETWLRANYPSVIYGPGQVVADAIDNYLFRTALTNNSALRTVILGYYNRFLRDEQAAFTAQIRAALNGAPFSSNFWQASPCEFVSGYTRRPALFDFAVAETAPDYWGDLLPHAIGSAAWYAVRDVQAARRHMNAVTYDMTGLRAFVEHKPTALQPTTPGGSGFPVALASAAPPRMVVQMLRQSIMQSVAEGASPVVPVDVFMTINDSKSQGVQTDGYRFWGQRADYKSCFDFIRANGSLLRGYAKCATVHLAVHNDSFPFQDGTSGARYQALLERLAELWRRDVDYHWMPVGAADGLLPQQPQRSVETSAPIVIRLQDDVDFSGALGRLAGPRCRGWSARAADEAMGYSPMRSTNPNVRALARYNATERRVSVHLVNYAVNADGTPSPQTTTLLWNWGGAGTATVTRLGESGGTVDLSSGAASVTLTEYAIVNFAVA